MPKGPRKVESSEKAAGEALTEPKKRKKRNSAEAEPVRATEENTQKPDTVATETEKKQKKKDKKKRQQSDSGHEPSEPALDQPAEGALLTEEQQPGKKAKKGKAAKRKKVADAKKPSGPGNASEAAQIRTVMGFEQQKDAAAAKQGSKGNTFNFGFLAGEAGGATAAERTDVTGAHVADDLVASSGPAFNGPANGGHDRQQDKPRNQPQGGGVPRRVFIGGMPFGYDEEEVRDYWSVCGEIEDMTLMRFPDTGRFKGIAFITFADETGYREALKCNGVMIDEQRVKVEPCNTAGSKGRPGKPRENAGAGRKHSQPAPKTPGYHVAYVGNLAFEASPSQLRKVFSGCDVSFVRLHTDKDTGKPKGFAHVHFEDEASLDRAIQYDGFELVGRSMKVGYAQPKKQ